MSSSVHGSPLNALRAFEATRHWGTGSSRRIEIGEVIILDPVI
jgi:hypothetical protein